MSQQKKWKLGDLIKALKKAYCHKIGVEYMHLTSRDECNWIRDKFEGTAYEEMTKEEKVKCLDRLMWSTNFGKFLANKFNTQKRFGLEGCESFVPSLKVMIDKFVDYDV
jgi:2-oxoglutarate dehydrogenase E1 component